MDAENPILTHTRYGDLNDRIQAIRSLDPSFSDTSIISLVRWLFEGRSHIFDDKVIFFGI